MATRSSRCFQAVEEAASRLRLMGVDTPNWEVLSAGLRPEEGRRVKHRERDPTQPRHGWQKVASAKVHKQHREEVVWPLLSSSQRASVRSQSGPLASVPFTSFPTCRVTRMESEPFTVLLLRRLRMPLPLSVRSCVCGRRLDLFGHHRAACSRAGVLSRRGFAVESAVEQICREAGARVSTNVMVGDLDIAGSNTRCTEVGGRGRGTVHFRRCAVGTGCNFGVHPSWGWDTFEEVRQDGRGCFAIGKEAQGGQVPRVERITRKGPFGGHCWGSWWTMVTRDSGFLAISGTLQGSWCTSHPSGERRGGVVQEVVQFAGVFGGQSGCSLIVGEAGQPPCGGPVTFGSGGVGETRGVRCERFCARW